MVVVEGGWEERGRKGEEAEREIEIEIERASERERERERESERERARERERVGVRGWRAEGGRGGEAGGRE
eukprot:24444-Hanusia_phi.AAC.1